MKGKMKKRSFNFESQDPEVKKVSETATKKLKLEREGARLNASEKTWRRRFTTANTKLEKIWAAQKRLAKRMEAVS